MLKKLVDKQKEANAKMKEAVGEFKDSMAEIQDKPHRKKAEELLMEGETIIQCYGLMVDFACITDKRLFFVDANFTNNKKKVVSIPLGSIVEVSCDYGYFRGEVEIITKNGEHELKMSKDVAMRFANELLGQVC